MEGVRAYVTMPATTHATFAYTTMSFGHVVPMGSRFIDRAMSNGTHALYDLTEPGQVMMVGLGVLDGPNRLHSIGNDLVVNIGI